MFTYEKIGKCPTEDDFPIHCYSHYKITFETDDPIIVCILHEDSPDIPNIFNGTSDNIPINCDYLIKELKQTEINYIISNIFDIPMSKHRCNAYKSYTEFDNNYILYVGQYYTYIHQTKPSINMDGAKKFANMYDLIDFLCEKFQHLLKSIKLAINDE